MIQRYSSVAGVVHALGDKATPRAKCMQCKRDDVTVYPLLALQMCAPCIVIATTGHPS